MTNAPERIWAEDISKAWLDDSGVWGVEREDHDVEYIRVDIHEALIKDCLDDYKAAFGEAVDEVMMGFHFDKAPNRTKELEDRLTWQPIETAPKDGTVIFVLYKSISRNPYSTFVNDIKKARWLDDLEEWSVEGVGGNIAPTLTRWMHLPEIPKEETT
jgi:hypothetical protein